MRIADSGGAPMLGGGGLGWGAPSGLGPQLLLSSHAASPPSAVLNTKTPKYNHE